MQGGSKKRRLSETDVLDDSFIEAVFAMICAGDFSDPACAQATVLFDHFDAWSPKDRLSFCFLLFAITEQHAGDLTRDINLSPQLGKLGIQCQATIEAITRGIQAWNSRNFKPGGDSSFHERTQAFFNAARGAENCRKRIAQDNHAKSVEGLSITKVDRHSDQTGRSLPDKLVLWVIGTEQKADDTAMQRKNEEYEKKYIQETADMLEKFPEIANIGASLVSIDGQPVLVILRQHDGLDDEYGDYMKPAPWKDVVKSTPTSDVDSKQAAGVILRSGCTSDMLLRVTLWNLGESQIKVTPEYVDFDGTCEKDATVDLAIGEKYELPGPLQRNEGEGMFGWNIYDAKDSVALGIEFTGDEVFGVDSTQSKWHLDLAQRMLDCKKKGMEDGTDEMSRRLRAMDVLFATARGPQAKGSTRSATGSASRATENDDVMFVRVLTAEELLQNSVQLRYVRHTDDVVDESDAVSFRPGETHLNGELRGGSNYCLQMAVKDSEATVEAVVAVPLYVHNALQSVEEATRALALRAMRQFPQTFVQGVWETVPVLCGLETADVLNAGSHLNNSCLVYGRDLSKYRYNISYTLKTGRTFAKHVELRPDGGAVIVQAAAGEMRAVVGQVVVCQRSSMEPNVTGEAFCALPSLHVAESVVVKECKAFVGDVCAICMENLVGSVTLMGCSNGHVMCGRCGVDGCRKLYKCPFCREVLDLSQQTVVPLMQKPKNSGV